MTNAEVGTPLKLRFVLSNVLCSHDDTAISLSTEVAGYGFGEWLHVCRLQAPLPALEAEFRPERLLVRWPFRCRKIVTYHIASPEHWMDLVNDYPYFFLQQRLDHLKTDGICSLQRLEALYVSVTRALGQLLMYFQCIASGIKTSCVYRDQCAVFPVASPPLLSWGAS